MRKKFIVNAIAMLSIFFPLMSDATLLKVSIAPKFKNISNDNLYVETYPFWSQCLGEAGSYISVKPRGYQKIYNNAVSEPFIIDARDWCDDHSGSYVEFKYTVFYRKADSSFPNYREVYSQGTIRCGNTNDRSRWDCKLLQDEKKAVVINPQGDSTSNGGNIVITMEQDF